MYVKSAIAILVIAIAATAAYLDRAKYPLMAYAAPSAPVRAVVALPGGVGLPDGGWATAGSLQLRVTLIGSDQVRTVEPELEVLPASIPFTGVANAAGTRFTLQPYQRSVVTLPISGLQNGRRYHWRVRTRSLDGSPSPWTRGGTFGISVTPPASPSLLSANAASGVPTNLRTISLHWSRPADRTGIAYYQWANSLDAQAAPTWHSTRDQELHLHTLGDGTWYVNVRAVDEAGLVSDPMRLSVVIDRSAPQLTDLTASSYNLAVGEPAARIRFSLSRTVDAVLNVQGTSSVREPAHIDAGTLTAGWNAISWDGKDAAGHFLPSGRYTLSISLRDALGNRTEQYVPGTFTIDTRRVVVSLTKQDMTVYDGSNVLVHTLITSGGPETQTPVGTFHVLAKYSPYVMRSPWPKTSRLWYATTTVNYAILFRSGGYFLHDASWRSEFGPCSNTVDGIPGGNTTGTHGCVNVPFSVEAWLYRWAQIGTVVQILA